MRACASATVLPRSRPRTLNLTGMKRLRAFVINPGRPGVQRDGRQFAQWDVGVGAAAGG